MGKSAPLFSPLILLLFIFSGCGRAQNIRTIGTSEGPNTDSPELAMQNMNMQSYGSKGLEWELKAPVAQGFSQKNLMHVKHMETLLYENGQKSTAITADDGFMNSGNSSGLAKEIRLSNGVLLESGDMFLQGHVVVISTEGSTLTTDWATYHKKSALITSTAPVQLIRSDSVTKGVGLEATADLAHVKIFNQTVTIKDQHENEKP
jgi:LPS export ABC transporter protein LptC